MKLEYVTHPDYLLAVVVGEFDLADAKQCINEVFRLCVKHQYTKVLVDSRGIPGQGSLASRFTLAEHLVAGYPRAIRIAMLCSTAQVEYTKLLQNATNNRGALVLTTDDETAARAYLKLA